MLWLIKTWEDYWSVWIQVWNRQEIWWHYFQSYIWFLHNWNWVDSICNMVFDTTTGNTGHISVACVNSTELRISTLLVWLLTLYSEVILTHLFGDINITRCYTFHSSKKDLGLIPTRQWWSSAPISGVIYSCGGTISCTWYHSRYISWCWGENDSFNSKHGNILSYLPFNI